MAPTVIVGDDETPAEVAARLLDLADNQRDVQLRTDLSRSVGYRVPDELYKRYTGRKSRSDTERQINALDERSAEAGEVNALSGDEQPDATRTADTTDPAGDLAGDIVGDQQPETAVNVEPPQNGEPDARTPDGRAARTSNDADQGDEQAKPRKTTTARKSTSRRATKATPATAGDGK